MYNWRNTVKLRYFAAAEIEFLEIILLKNACFVYQAFSCASEGCWG